MPTPVSSLVRSDIAGFAAYTPIVPLDVLAQRLGMAQGDLVKLDANENPYGPTAATRAAIAALATPDGARTQTALYPDPDTTQLRAAIGAHLGVTPARIICGNGSDELIDLLIKATITPGQALVDATPTFGMYAFTAQLYQARYIAVPRTADFGIDIDAMRSAITTHQARIVVLAAPNNPTGNPLTRAELLALLELDLIVVSDEAYAEFSGISFLDLIDQYPNLVVLRTFSKWAGLAGLRVGYGVMHESLADEIRKIKPPYTVSVVAEAAATAAVRDYASMRPLLDQICADRDTLAGQLTALGCHVFPSVANFLLVRTPVAAPIVRDALLNAGVLIRFFPKPRLDDCIRISIGTSAQHERLLDVLEATFRTAKP